MKEYKFNKEWLNKLLEVKDNDSVWLSLSDNDTRILLTYIEVLQSRIDKAIDYIENDMPYLEEPDDDYENNHKMIEYDRSDLLNILKGEDK